MFQLKKILLLLYNLYQSFRRPFKQLNNWYIPNLVPLLNKQIKFLHKAPACEQTTCVTGSGKVQIGNACRFGYKLGGGHKKGYVEIQPRYKQSTIKIGDHVNSNNNLFLCAANYIEIGNNTLVGQNVTIMDHEAHGVPPAERRKIGAVGHVVIGQNVWIGNNVMILKNSEIGENTIVAAGAVVSGKFPANVVIGGVPAKIIKQLNVD